jgi:hypothetical protein
VTQPKLDSIIERLHACIIDARSLQLKMLEQVLSMALVQARSDKRDLDRAAETKDG